MLSRC